MKELNPAQRDALAEVVNISFGRAVAVLARILRLHIHMSVPHVTMMPTTKLVDYIFSVLTEPKTLTLVQQSFKGELFGEAVMVLSSVSGKELVRVMSRTMPLPSLAPDKLEMEVLLEVGNILISSCLGELAKLVGMDIGFDAPEVFWHNLAPGAVRPPISASLSEALVIRIATSVEKSTIEGFLVVMLLEQTWQKLVEGIDELLAQVEPAQR